MKIINPANDETIKEIDVDTPESVGNKFKALNAGQVNWGKKPLSERIETISKFQKLLKQNIDSLSDDLTAETGKPLQESKNEINASCGKIDFFLNESEKHLAEEQVNEDGNTLEKISYDPLGTIANISAWNYPFLVGINIFIPALICGNSVLYKPSEYATMTGLNITRLMHEAGVPQDVFTVAIGGAAVGQTLLELDFDGYFFTGSYATGKKIATEVAHKLVPVGLELGGKDPLYVTDEIPDVKAAAENAADGAFYNNGQSCCSVERIYVHSKVYDEFVEHFIKTTKNLKVGNPLDENINQGAITRKAHLAYLKAQVDDAKNKGATIECGGDVKEGPGAFFNPTVLTNVNHTMEVMREETFGPVIGIQKVANDKVAIERMNDTHFGLTSAVFTTNEERGLKILKQIKSGTGYLNCCDRVSGYLPWSGRGASGLGSTLSKHGLFAFCNPKGLHIRS